MTTATLAESVLDLSTVPPEQRHDLVFTRLAALAVGETLELADEHAHDPVPLLHQIERRCPGQFTVAALEGSSAQWRLAIRRAARASIAASSCCSGGACCG
ncbi:DUF2249 domain-containing protein [Ideonella sp. A 288]|uniref:DUF2249 domain-containing protein n=1 Tax=Ideonella sp. A 288 TaxID=1962181 RepID=UPI000B4A95FB|nr:DUF2249 domain-containing protein [Ideonella sp. A 288]